jgi:hypothetical protein
MQISSKGAGLDVTPIAGGRHCTLVNYVHVMIWCAYPVKPIIAHTE